MNGGDVADVNDSDDAGGGGRGRDVVGEEDEGEEEDAG